MENDDQRHRREEQERRAKRKASKMSKSDAQRHKERQGKEYRQKILQQQQGSSSKRQKTSSAPKGSAFQALFQQRAQGFQIDFRFRNAPPRPPVGPCFVGDTLKAVLLGQSRQYKPLNAVEANYVWKLHTEVDLGVPLAPSAMDLKAYTIAGGDKNHLPPISSLHPSDQALLEWKGSMGDTAADQRRKRQEQVRAAARQWLQNGNTNLAAPKSKLQAKQQSKKAFSRVLREEMQTWMKKTTYLSNDYSRRVHDFKSLAQTKQELAADLRAKQAEMSKSRSPQAIAASFDKQATKTSLETIKHPTKKHLKPVAVMDVLPNVANWGRAFTQVVIDKAPTNLPKGFAVENIGQGAYIGNVERRGINSRMSCQVMAMEKKVPEKSADNDSDNEPRDYLVPVQEYDLDIVPLKEEDTPHINFCFWVNAEQGVATYLPLASRIQLATGRPVVGAVARTVERRDFTDAEVEEMERRTAEVDQELAEKHQIEQNGMSGTKSRSKSSFGATNDDKDDGEGDFGDDDSDSDNDRAF